MTPVNLAVRDAAIREYMDDPECNPRRLTRTYQDFRLVNRLVSNWASLYRRRIRPLLSPTRTTSLLDIGSGGGDITRALAGWARRDGLRLEVTAIDPDPRAYSFAVQSPRTGVRYRRASSTDLIREDKRFDVVISNHLVHHLEDQELTQLLNDSRELASALIIHNDIARSSIAYALYGVAALPLARRSFIRVDGLRSIRRSYHADELSAAVGNDWSVQRQFPYRLILTAEPRCTP